ncbi:MAG: FAD:protein FMN transferase [Hyphomonadaceae bacterium]|nr:FAD:protein FMN transferase [Hyphomonadaceae bacterium]
MPDVRLLIPAGMKPAHVRASRIDAPVRRLSGATMGTGWSLSFAAPDSVANTAVVAALEETFALVIQQMSNWEPGSDLSRFNRETGWHNLKPDFFAVLSRALEIAELTDGAYDPTLGVQMDTLGFGPPVEVPALRRKRHWREIQLAPNTHRAMQPGALALDLSSIAKGHAVDLCAARLRALGIPSFLMEIGGEFVGEGVKPDAQPWWVQLELSDIAPAPGEPPQTDVALVNLAIATSGDFVRRRDGISHLLDGRTGAPIRGNLSGVSVMHASAMEADGWATALFALGAEQGMAMANAQNLAAVFASRSPEGARSKLSAKAQEMLG